MFISVVVVNTILTCSPMSEKIPYFIFTIDFLAKYPCTLLLNSLKIVVESD